MTDYSKMFEQMMEQSQQMLRAFNPALENFQAQGFDKMMPTMPKDFMEMVWGNAFNKDGLDAKTRLLAMIAGMTVQGAPVEPMFKTTVRHALEAGASAKEVGEVIYQMSMLGGLPAMTRALGFAQEVFTEHEEEEKMTVVDFAFYLFAITVVTAGLLTVVSRHPVHSVLWLILAFLSSAGLFVLLGAEFVAMLLIIVYVGAVAVLFLFVVMMLDVDFAELKGEMARYMPLALLMGVIILMQLALAFGVWESSERAEGLRTAVTPAITETHNTAALGLLIYDDYILQFQLAGLILLVAMIGAIVLTLRHRTNVKRQDILAQMYRDPAKAMELKDVKPGQGL